jgi:Leucine-rich repeat (LRR) protein
VATPSLPPTSPARRDWLDVTARLATSWVGLFTAYVAALILAITKFKEFAEGLEKMHLPPWAGIALIASFPVLALVFSTIPALVDQRRIQRYSEIKGTIQPGYFTLRPREGEEDFKRADNAHEETLRWIENASEPVLYLTGASGSGKSSILSAWVIPKLEREKHVVIQLRGYEDVLARLTNELLEPGAFWERPPKADEVRSLLSRASQRLGKRHLLIVVDQFEEFLILADQERQGAFQEFLSGKPIEGVTVLLVFRPEYEGLLQDQPWPRMQLDTNRKVISPFTENAAHEFISQSRLAVSPDLLRKVLREAAEIEQTAGLIRPVTINMCGLVLGRFSTGLPRRFRGGIIRGFLRESLSLPEVRDVAERLIPALITDNVTKRPRCIDDLVEATELSRPAVRACLRRLGESDRAILRPLDQEQETWEISHDFLVPLLDAIVARRIVSVWRRYRPWLPWTTVVIMGIVATMLPRGAAKQNPQVALVAQGWTVSEFNGTLQLRRSTSIPKDSVSILRSLATPLSLGLKGTNVTDVSLLGELENLTALDISHTNVTDLSALRGLKNLESLDLSRTFVTDEWALRKLTSLRNLDMSGSTVTNVPAIRELKNLATLNLSYTDVTDLSPLQELRALTKLDLSYTHVTDISALRKLQNLRTLDLKGTHVNDVSALRELTNLTTVDLLMTEVTDVSALRELNNLKELDLSFTRVKDVSPLAALKNLTRLSLRETNVRDVSP